MSATYVVCRQETKDKIVQFANEQLNKWKLSEKGWRFQWCRAKRFLGFCCPNTRTIQVSIKYVEGGTPFETLKDTVLHEIAHALAGCHNGHNEKWKAMCLIVGAKPERCCTTEVKSVEHAWTANCSKCGKQFGFHRKPYMFRIHNVCGKESRLVNWKHKGIPYKGYSDN